MLLMLLPQQDYDPTESSVPWQALTTAGHPMQFATPTGEAAHADPRLVSLGFGLLNPMLMTRPDALSSYASMTNAASFRAPLAYDNVDPSAYAGLVVPGGHAPGMRTMLESPAAQQIVQAFFSADKPVAAVCHGVLLLARTQDPATGRSVLHGRRTTALPATMELSAYALTCAWLGSYYRTYPVTVQAEVTAALARPGDFAAGPLLARRDSHKRPQTGFVVKDGNYLSARWPGDCHRFAAEVVAMVGPADVSSSSVGAAHKAPGRPAP